MFNLIKKMTITEKKQILNKEKKLKQKLNDYLTRHEYRVKNLVLQAKQGHFLPTISNYYSFKIFPTKKHATYVKFPSS